MRCTTTVGPGAALAGARPFGRIDRYSDALPDDPKDLLAGCVLSMVDLGTIAGGGTSRRAAAPAARAQLAKGVAARPERSLIMVAGLSDTAGEPRLHAAGVASPRNHPALPPPAR